MSATRKQNISEDPDHRVGVSYVKPSDFIRSHLAPALFISSSTCIGGASCTGAQGTKFDFNGYGFTPNGTLHRFIVDSNGNETELSPVLSADADGALSWSFTSSCSSVVGTFLIYSRDAASNKTSNKVTEIITAGTCTRPQPDLAITETAAPNPLTSGGALTYNIKVQNIGNAGADSVSLTDTLPAAVIFQSCSIPCNISGKIVTANLGSLAAGGTAFFNINALAPLT